MSPPRAWPVAAALLVSSASSGPPPHCDGYPSDTETSLVRAFFLVRRSSRVQSTRAVASSGCGTRRSSYWEQSWSACAAAAQPRARATYYSVPVGRLHAASRQSQPLVEPLLRLVPSRSSRGPSVVLRRGWPRPAEPVPPTRALEAARAPVRRLRPLVGPLLRPPVRRGRRLRQPAAPSPALPPQAASAGVGDSSRSLLLRLPPSLLTRVGGRCRNLPRDFVAFAGGPHRPVVSHATNPALRPALGHAQAPCRVIGRLLASISSSGGPPANCLLCRRWPRLLTRVRLPLEPSDCLAPGFGLLRIHVAVDQLLAGLGQGFIRLMLPSKPGSHRAKAYAIRVVAAHPADRIHWVGKPVQRSVSGGPGPSIINLPTAGCWRLEVDGLVAKTSRSPISTAASATTAQAVIPEHWPRPAYHGRPATRSRARRAEAVQAPPECDPLGNLRG